MRLLLLAFSLAGSYASASGMSEFPIWKFVRLGHTSYIIGTHHVDSLRLHEIPLLKQLVQNAEVLMPEMDDGPGNLQPFYRRPYDRTALLDAEAQNRAQKFLDTQLYVAQEKVIAGLRDAIYMYKPQVFFAGLFAFLTSSRTYEGPCFDQQIRDAVKVDTPVYPLDHPFVLERTFLKETSVEEIDDVLMEMFAETGKLSATYLTKRARKNFIDEYVENYKNLKLNLETREKELAEMPPALRKVWSKVERELTKRHEAWLQQILAVTKKHNAVIAVGFGHVVDTEFPGLLTLLEPYGKLTKISLPVTCEEDLSEVRPVEVD